MAWFRGLILLCSSSTVDGLVKLISEYMCADSRVFYLEREEKTDMYTLARTDGGKTGGIVVMKDTGSRRWQARFDDKA